MRRLLPLDQLLVVLFVPLWALCFGLGVRAAVRQTGYAPIYVSRPAADEYPTLSGFKTAAAEGSGLRPGDRLLRVGDIDLRGVGPVGLSVVFAGWTGPERPVPMAYERDGRPGETALPVGSYRIYWPRLPASLAFAFVAVFLLVRARPSPMLRTIVQTYMCVALLLTCAFAGGPWETGFSIAVHVISLSLAAPLAVRGALLFPHGIEASAAWARHAHWLFALLGPLDASRFYELPFSRSLGTLGAAALGLVNVAALVGLTLRSYRRADAIGRRQLKWFLFGAYCALLPPLLATGVAAYDARFTPLLVVSMSALGVIPICLLIAVVHYNLFDVDHLLSAATSYTLFGVMLLAALLAVAPRLAHAVSGPIGVEPNTAQLVLSVLLASLVVVLYQQLRPRVDQVLFVERYALVQGFQRLLDELSACPDAQTLTRLSGERLDGMLRPESVVVYGRDGEAFVPVFVHGRVAPTAFNARGALVAALEERAAPLTAPARRGPTLSPFDRAALETLGVPVVVPIRRGAVLVAFVCLGPKRSGDVYTSTDLALLTALTDKLSGELLRFDQSQMLDQARAMQEALRRYVPGAVAAEIESGREPGVGECEVAVLFVDIRGYSSYAEGRKAEEIFSTVNRYTEAVSEIVRAHGGSVVEFSGDGMMAVFGAPRPLPHKERAAVETGQRICAAVRGLPVADAAPMSVGVGVATGSAFVGNVRAVDRSIWTAIGNTVNLAARLQALTREMAAAMVIDETTWSRAGEMVGAFVRHPDVAIRGRAQPETVYVLPLAA